MERKGRILSLDFIKFFYGLPATAGHDE